MKWFIKTGLLNREVNMQLKPPVQSKDNPFNIIDRRVEWVDFEYQKGRGSKHGLVDYAKRYKLLSAILNDRNVTPTVAEAMAYLLEVPYEG